MFGDSHNLILTGSPLGLNFGRPNTQSGDITMLYGGVAVTAPLELTVFPGPLQDLIVRYAVDYMDQLVARLHSQQN